MGIGDAGVAMVESQLNLCVPAKGRLGRMTTELMEVFSLEVGDTIEHHGELFRILDIGTAPNGGIDIYVTDEEGFRRIIYAAGPMDKVNILIEES
jgi:hypothetical protein